MELKLTARATRKRRVNMTLDVRFQAGGSEGGEWTTYDMTAMMNLFCRWAGGRDASLRADEMVMVLRQGKMYELHGLAHQNCEGAVSIGRVSWAEGMLQRYATRLQVQSQVQVRLRRACTTRASLDGGFAHNQDDAFKEAGDEGESNKASSDARESKLYLAPPQLAADLRLIGQSPLTITVSPAENFAPGTRTSRDEPTATGPRELEALQMWRHRFLA
nr:hypothetical protein CFP56_70409 [Quercus suber]